MRTRLWLALLLLTAGCAGGPLPPRPTTPIAAAAAPRVCRVGPDGGMPVADRGIGGTGIEAGPKLVDRGIGGTGQRTGIVGVITGFASVCVGGEEVQYAAGLPVTMDGKPAPLAQLRVGQVAVIEAAGPSPVALSLVVRHEVSGPVQRIEPDGTLLVAGQRVVPPPNAAPLPPGAWIEVSGFHRPDGVIMATRFDPRGPGETLVRGIMVRQRGHFYIGLLEIHPGRDQDRPTGIPMTAIGRLNGSVLEADTLEPDLVLLDPAQYFGASVGSLLIEGYAEGGYMGFGRRFRVGGPGFAGVESGRALARFERGPGGGFTPAFARPFGPQAGFGPAPYDPARGFGRVDASPRGGFQSAPMPDRGFDRGRPPAGLGGGIGASGPAGRPRGEGPGESFRPRVAR